jgi:hypothetical protein
MRSGIIAATVPSSRVQIICRCNSLTRDAGTNKAERGQRSGPALREVSRSVRVAW